MFRNLVKIGSQHPDLRSDIEPILDRLKSASADRVVKARGSDRQDWMNDVYDMIVQTYESTKHGVPVDRPSDLLKYPLWKIYLKDGEPKAVELYKETKFGLKSGLSGFDGSSDGKRIQVNNLKDKFTQSGVYGEVSGKVEDIVVNSGAPRVPVEYVGDILGKDIEPTGDGYHYMRNISGIGDVKKVMVGNPKINIDKESSVAFIPDTSECDRDHHLFCLAFDQM